MGSRRVWLDILTPKQVLFFAPLVEELSHHGFDILATSRRYREVEPVARMCGLDLQYVGERGGKDPSEQLAAATQRQAELIPIVKGFGPTVALSVASGVCARIAFGLRVRHISVNDSPHSEIAGRLSIPLSHHLLCPWIIPYEEWAKFGLTRSQITRYRALDPAVWLKRKPLNGPAPELERSKKTITVRLEENYAPYMAGTNGEWTGTVLQNLAEAFPESNLVALCRYGDQLESVKGRFGSRYIVPSYVVDGRRLLAETDLFVGMGGTMTAEAALMGVPTISAFQGTLHTELYLKSVGLLVKTNSPPALLSHARKLLDSRYKVEFARKAKRILGSMEDPVHKISDRVVKTAEQA